MKDERQKGVLTIAGSDPCAGAGIQADLKTGVALHTYVATAVTAVTAQNSDGLREVGALTARRVCDQIDAVVADIQPMAVKVGLVPTVSVSKAIARSMKRHRLTNVVVDPVDTATAGGSLATSKSVYEPLYRLCTVLTPNLPEAEAIIGRRASEFESAGQMAAAVAAVTGAKAVVLKGGHGEGDLLVDALYDSRNGTTTLFAVSKIDTGNLHGTGCGLSTAIACRLAAGATLTRAVADAEIFVRKAIVMASKTRWRNGYGPINHSLTDFEI